MKKILYLITEDWFFCSHFFERAKSAVATGYEVIVMANDNGKAHQIKSAGIKFIPLKISRKSKNPFKELISLTRIFYFYLKERPDIVHQIAIKPILYGTLAARLAGLGKVVNAPVGMGYFFSSRDFIAKIARPLIIFAFKILLNPRGSKVIFENKDDMRDFIISGIVDASDAVLIRGAGVNLIEYKKFQVDDGKTSTPIVVLIARMLKDKGIFEFLAAARIVNKNGVIARFVLVGDADPENPASISSEVLSQYDGNFGVEYWGWRDDVAAVLAQSYAVCLPSYREGLPKVLLEAAAAGLPIITTDAVGCREVVIDGFNGYIVPVRDFVLLADAIRRIVDTPEIARVMGANGRQKVVDEFSNSIVIEKTLNLYDDILAEKAS